MTEKKKGGARAGAGRPSSYNADVAKEICHRLCEGEPLRQICRDERMPAWRTVHDWRHAHPEFEKEYQLARDLGMDAIAEDLLDIADDGSNDFMEKIDKEGKKTGEFSFNLEHVQRSKLRIETRLKLLAKWNPKKFGDSITHRGDNNAPLPLVLNGSDVHG